MIKPEKWSKNNPCGIVGLRFANPTYEKLLSDCIWLLQALLCRSG